MAESLIPQPDTAWSEDHDFCPKDHSFSRCFCQASILIIVASYLACFGSMRVRGLLNVPPLKDRTEKSGTFQIKLGISALLCALPIIYITLRIVTDNDSSFEVLATAVRTIVTTYSILIIMMENNRGLSHNWVIHGFWLLNFSAATILLGLILAGNGRHIGTIIIFVLMYLLDFVLSFYAGHEILDEYHRTGKWLLYSDETCYGVYHRIGNDGTALMDLDLSVDDGDVTEIGGPLGPIEGVIDLARRIYKTLGNDWISIIVGASVSVVQGLLAIVCLVVVGEVLDDVNLGQYSHARNPQSTVAREAIGILRIAMLILFSLLTFMSLLFFVRTKWMSELGDRLAMRLRCSIFDNVLQQEYAFHEELQSNRVLDSLTTDVVTLRHAAVDRAPQLLVSATEVVCAFIFCFVISWKLSLVLLTIAPAVAIVFAIQIKGIGTHVQVMQKTMDKAMTVVEHALASMHAVRLYSREDEEFGSFQKLIRRVYEKASQIGWAAATLGAAFEFSLFTSVCIGLYYGGLLVLRGDITAGNLFAFMFVAINGVNGVQTIVSSISFLDEALSAGRRVFGLVDRYTFMNYKGGIKPNSIDGVITFDNVLFYYPWDSNSIMLKNFSLRVGLHETVAIVGPDIKEISTPLLLLQRLYDPQGGEVKVDGLGLTVYEPQWFRRQVACVGREAVVFEMSVMENIRVARPEASDADIVAICSSIGWAEMIEHFPSGYSTVLTASGDDFDDSNDITHRNTDSISNTSNKRKLSPFALNRVMRHRLSLARAAIRCPCILIIEESYFGVSLEEEANLNHVVRGLMKGRTNVIAARSMAMARSADTVVVVVDGAVVEKGRLSELLRRPGSSLGEHFSEWLEVDHDADGDGPTEKKKKSRKKKNREQSMVADEDSIVAQS